MRTLTDSFRHGLRLRIRESTYRARNEACGPARLRLQGRHYMGVGAEDANNLETLRVGERIARDAHTQLAHDRDRRHVFVVSSGHAPTQLEHAEGVVDESPSSLSRKAASLLFWRSSANSRISSRSVSRVGTRMAVRQSVTRRAIRDLTGSAVGFGDFLGRGQLGRSDAQRLRQRAHGARGGRGAARFETRDGERMYAGAARQLRLRQELAQAETA